MNHKHSRGRGCERLPEAIAFARNQRKTANEFAHTLWQLLRNRQCRNQKFRREYPIPPYTVDFCCPALKLVVEVDGKHHLTEEGIVYDRRRDAFLSEKGYQLLRIPGYKVGADARGALGSVEKSIDKLLSASAPSPPTPLPRTSSGGEGSQNQRVR